MSNSVLDLSKEFAGRRVLVTGGSRGIGAAIAQALVGLSRVELRAGAYDSVRAHAGEASALLTRTGDTLGAIGPSHMVAAVNRMTGRDSDAASLYERTLARYRSLSDGAGVAGELMNLGYVRLHQGRRADARSLFRDAAGRFALTGVPPGAYTIVAWHKAAGFFRQNIQVTGDRATAVEFFIPLDSNGVRRQAVARR